MSSLSERVAAAKAAESGVPVHDGRPTGKDDLTELKRRLHFKVVEGLGPQLYDRQMSDAELKVRVMEMLDWALDQEESIPISRAERDSMMQEISDDVLGYGPIDALLKDEDVTEIMVNGPHAVYVERSGRLTESGAQFVDATHLRRIIEKIVSQNNPKRMKTEARFAFSSDRKGGAVFGSISPPSTSAII